MSYDLKGYVQPRVFFAGAWPQILHVVVQALCLLLPSVALELLELLRSIR